MTFSAVLALAAKRLARRPFRSFLLLQGTVWGVAVAIFPSAVIAGTREAALQRGSELGADRVSVAADPTAQAARPLERADVVATRDALAAGGIPPRAVGGVRVLRVVGEAGAEGALVEADPDAPVARGLELVEGRLLGPEDGPGDCVVESEAWRWGAQAPLAPGDAFEIERDAGRPVRLTVVGVLAPRSALLRRTNDLGFDVAHPVFRKVGRALLLALGIPYVEDAWKRSDGVVYVPPSGDERTWIFARVPTADVGRAAGLVSDALVARGCSPVTLHPLVLPVVLSDQMERFAAVNVAMFLSCLVMGAVVTANLGLLTVLRRGREIAIRRVEGATRAAIAGQFLVEGLALTAVGCVLGIVLGLALAQLRVSFEPVAGFAWAFPTREAAIAVAVALAVGGLASLLPAWRAAAQDPVEGLVDD